MQAAPQEGSPRRWPHVVTPAHVAGFSRLVLAPLALVIVLDTPAARVWGVAIIAAAGLSDIIDGWLARRYRTVSTFGVFLDLTADKLFAAVVLVGLLHIDRAPLGVIVTVLMREFIVMGLRAYAAAQSYVIPGGGLGAVKTVVLFAGMAVALLARGPGFVLLWAAAALAVVSGIRYAIAIARHHHP